MSSSSLKTPFLVEQRHMIIVPSYSAWFNMSTIHEIEKKSNPEFFGGNSTLKTPTAYKDIRDFMINTYRLDPSEYLTVTACRRNLLGDACSIIRVHAFLEQWGLINYQVDPETRPNFKAPPFNGKYNAVNNTPKMTQEVLAQHEAKNSDEPIPKQITLQTKVYNSVTNQMEPKDAVDETEQDKAEAPFVHVQCFTCGVDCSHAYYHNLKMKKHHLCRACYEQGRFPSSFTSADFLRMDTAYFQQYRDDEWTNQETLLLLEAIEMYDSDWNQISMHVGTRSREQCLVHFLQLPIEDPYRISVENQVSTLKNHSLPFSEADNPVLSILTYLASVLIESKQKAHNNNETTKNDGEQSAEPQASETSHLEKAATVALKVAARKAGVLADYEKRQMQRLVYLLVQTQVEKVNLKMEILDQLEEISSFEFFELDRQRKQLLIEQLSTKKMLLDVGKQVKEALSLGNDQGLAIIDKLLLSEGKEIPLTFESPPSVNVRPISEEFPSEYRSIAL
ncbi:SWI/SNF and RSC complex subunit Ssr2 [Schizosaccharomyces japonicus yFS275]|uniref:SWI/SNF and RSC complex subunit Ssr2 n=1 Tax=Schizosaccharomyces japonicus (strain yFS275 / FY16936) TaxID=402676 RepID=B6K2H9_SCHJY|nr:SWI/SNF and RSC complex subunit Ssr2 [Schizosaccharomyces japonicus yFS275]EEB07360.1 SWI/SNF and RSC complex subunit Ssr2 [Schizosaccharomyces japonicus yFS275]